MRIYHGSDSIIENPKYNGSKRTNDYGYGFYTTENIELAKEWACSGGTDGFANIYDFDMSRLSVLNLNDGHYSILNWLAILTQYRSYWQNGSISERAKDYLQQHFFVDPKQYDVIIGNRADDSYYTFAQDFMAGAISLKKLSEAMHLGKLGEQIVLKSEKAFSRIRYTGSENAEAKIYYEKKSIRDRDARRAYRAMKRESEGLDEIYMIDIMREEMKNNDPRLR